MKNLLIALIVTFSIFAIVIVNAPTKTIAGTEYKMVFGSPISKF